MRNIIRKLLPVAIAVGVIILAGLFLSAYGQRQRAAGGNVPAAQQPLFTDYKGVKLGMSA